MNDTDKKRSETDFLGAVDIPEWAYWGAQTQRAIDNFTVSGHRIPKPMLDALAVIKREAAEVNRELGLLDPELAGAIVTAALEILGGAFGDQFPVDVFQTGSGTSWNMNLNEVIANRANEILGRPIGRKKPVHPNDHVNLGQSSNDVIPSAINIATRRVAGRLVDALDSLVRSLAKKEGEFSDVVKVGRTHLQDAVPITLGQEFSGYRTQAAKGRERLKAVLPGLEELPLGGTAVGTGVNTHPQFAKRVIERIAADTGFPFREAECRFEAIASRDAQVALMGALNGLAASLMKIANDVRLLASGPRAGFGELALAALQPGSSIMPGKINPVIPEIVIQAAAHVIGQAAAVTVAGLTGPLDLQIMQPLIAFESLSALEILANAVHIFDEKCVRGMTANKEHCEELVQWSLAMVTPLALKVGYDRASAIAVRASKEKKTVREIAIAEGVVTEAEADVIFDPRRLLSPSADDGAKG
ncbi:MAG: class II fumarate hydratase [Spirochaetales bacterium]|nr:class II fumarate hydratase [Spirochaetales bacterium]